MHARRRHRDIGDIVDAFGGLQNGVDQDGLFDRVLRFQLSEELVEIVDIPGSFDLGQHDHVEPLAHRADDLDHVVEYPRRVECVDARPQAGCAEVIGFCHRDETCPRRLLGIGRDCVLQIAEHYVDLCDQLRHLGAHFLDMRRHEMDHAFKLDRQLAQRRWRADRQRLEEVARELHLPNPSSPTGCSRLRYEGTPRSRQALLQTSEEVDERKGGSAPARARGEVAALRLGSVRGCR